MVESVFINPWFFPTPKRRSYMPLAEMNRFISVSLQDLRNGDFIFEQMHVMHVILNDGVDSGPEMMPACQQGRSRG